ncbi:endonuclease/exonuclease/phosphatase family protein [Myxococcota bacterium]|nr:endonuclease/exonuclease/phosphatase family protein [Myxococcota bacterium]MBU1429514.1 endonuclease/exonuclease/phosphatase family protein [Myxococcota bacterium]MBU1896577.1 endonuclease/exonuclease/phosphatase family protein [Myxococcota bacterium]
MMTLTELRLNLGWGLLWCLAAATGFGLLGGVDWRLDLFSHFPLLYLALSLVVLVLVIGREAAHYKPMGFAAALAALNLALLAPALSAAPMDEAGIIAEAEGDTPVRLLIANVNRSNPAFEPLTQEIRLHTPDVVGLVEFGGQWAARMTLALPEDRYPHRLLEPRDDNFGLALYSKLPFKGSARIDPRTSFPVIHAHFERGFDLVLLHAPPPMSALWSAARDAQIYELSELEGERVILAGDFNATVWSKPIRALIDDGWAHGRAGRGLQPSWPDLPGLGRLAGIGIDHVFTRGLPILSHEIGGSIGSDHLPLIVEIAAPKAAPKPQGALKAKPKAAQRQ